MKRTIPLLFTLAFSTILAACNRPQTELPQRHRAKWDRVSFERSDVKDFGVSGALAQPLTCVLFYWADSPSLMVWIDGNLGVVPLVKSGDGPNGGDGPTMQFRAGFTSQGVNGRDGYIDVEIRDAQTARFLYVGWPKPDAGDRPFLTGAPVLDAKDGACLLASSATGEFRVEQLKVDLTKVNFTKEGLLALAAKEPEIKTFFASPKGQ